jgi:hypothetical protein
VSGLAFRVEPPIGIEPMTYALRESRYQHVRVDEGAAGTDAAMDYTENLEINKAESPRRSPRPCNFT